LPMPQSAHMQNLPTRQAIVTMSRWNGNNGAMKLVGSNPAGAQAVDFEARKSL